jgi:hypothetical protein
MLQWNPQFTFIYFHLATLCNWTYKPARIKVTNCILTILMSNNFNWKLQCINFPLSSSKSWHHVALWTDTRVLGKYYASIFSTYMTRVKMQSGYTATVIRNVVIQNHGTVRKGQAYIH